MKNRKLVSTLLILMLPLMGSKCTNDGLTTSDNCSVQELQWVKVTEGYDSKTVIDLAAKLSAVAKVDAERIKLLKEGSAKASLASDLSKVINASSTKSAEVSQEFFQRAFQYRQAVCSIERQIKSKILTSPAALEKAQLQLINFSEQFNTIQKDEENRSRINPQQSGISFGSDSKPFDLGLSSSSDDILYWKIRGSNFFEIFPSEGVMPANGSTIVRITPLRDKFNTNLIEESLWFDYGLNSTFDKKFSISLKAINPQPVVYSVHSIDDQLHLYINGKEYSITTNADSKWQTIPPKLFNPGLNYIEIRVHNVASRRGFMGEKEGWSYNMSIKIGEESYSFNGSSNGKPPTSQWGTTFEVKKLHLVLDASNGQITLSEI